MVNGSVADEVVSVFRNLYGQRFPIRQMRSVDVYKGSDDASMTADNTSGFNCRRVGTSGSWSQHAYGLAIDVNPRENPYIHPYPGGHPRPPNAKDYVRRPLDRPGVINPGDDVVHAFKKIGWGWGGSWSTEKDYQHFSPERAMSRPLRDERPLIASARDARSARSAGYRRCRCLDGVAWPPD